jgi:hypothetical protein
MESLKDHFNKSQKYLKLGDKDTFKGLYVSWEPIQTKYGKPGYKFTFEREDGSRLEWTTSNMSAVQQIADLIEAGLKKGDPIKIYREGVEKTDTKYTITAELPF